MRSLASIRWARVVCWASLWTWTISRPACACSPPFGGRSPDYRTAGSRADLLFDVTHRYVRLTVSAILTFVYVYGSRATLIKQSDMLAPDHYCILVAEDDEIVRYLTARSLSQQGYCVLQAR